MKTPGGRKGTNNSEYEALVAFPVSPHSFSGISADRQFGIEHIYLFTFLTEQQSCYAMNRFLYILITSTSWCERGRLQIMDFFFFLPTDLSCCSTSLHIHEKAIWNSSYCKWCTFASASLRSIPATTTMPLLLLPRCIVVTTCII